LKEKEVAAAGSKSSYQGAWGCSVNRTRENRECHDFVEESRVSSS